MYGFSVLLHGVTASFREPSAHLYQATLPLPPVSALVGMAGAALGRTFEDVWRFAKNVGFCVGVSGTSEGKGIDLWNYHKMAAPKGAQETAQARQYNLSKIVRRDILNREFLVYPKITVFYAMQSDGHAETLRKAFTDPVYALSLGNSDDIVCVKKISAVCEVKAVDESTAFSDTCVVGDRADDVQIDWDMLKRTGVAQTLKAPLVRPLIVDFEFKGMERHGSRFQLFTFLSGPQRLMHPQLAFRFAEAVAPIPLYGLAGEISNGVSE